MALHSPGIVSPVGVVTPVLNDVTAASANVAAIQAALTAGGVVSLFGNSIAYINAALQIQAIPRSTSAASRCGWLLASPTT
jgi:hypothetical protein